jgi:polysaccharide pyruvyl transferase WcaK-like protein
MGDTLHILVADYVPLANKGEEAIIRGIEDMLSDGRPVSVGLFDNVTAPGRRDNLTVFPRDWLFRFEGNSRQSGWGRVALQAVIAMQLRLGIYSRLKNLTREGDEEYRPLQDFFERADYVLVGHDGVFCVESCGVIYLAKKHGKRVGVLGASTGIDGGRFYKAGLYRKAFQESNFCVFRERLSCESIKRIYRGSDKLTVGPDPAFAMRPENQDDVYRVLQECEGYCLARSAGRAVVAVTTLEKGRVYAGFRPDLRGAAKQRAHAQYVAAILDALVAEHKAFILFLPHSVEKSSSDTVAARHVTEQMRSKAGDYMILEKDCPARLLKGIIGQCDFLVGQRTHSLIGGVSMGIPFVALTNRRDTRTHGIIGEMCRCEHQIVDMDVTDQQEAARKAVELFASRLSIRTVLEEIRRDLSGQIAAISRMVKGPSQMPRGI